MSHLADLGLSNYEERAYRALVTTGPATARTVVDRSGVPEGRIYDVLNGLETRGLVQSRAGDPRRYAAVDPETAIDRLLAERLEELDAARDRYRDLAASARSGFGPTPPVDGNVWLADLGDENSTTLIDEQLSAATDRFVMAAGPPYEAAAYEAYAPEIETTFEHLESGIDVDVLCSRPFADVLRDRIGDRLAAAPSVRLRQRPRVDVTFDVVDGSEAYVEVPHPFAAGRRFGFVEVRDPAVAGAFEAAFDEVWEEAEPVF